MAEPIFKTIDFSKQIAEDQARTNAANLAGIQNLANTYVAGRQENINQARQLMSDFDAVINEVDDIHKEGVSEAIAETQKKLANNIYRKKGKNGVRLNLGDLNSKDFNYARDMRKLKNMATNSRLVKQQLTDVKNNIKTDQYILSNADRASAAADVSTYLSSAKALNQSPEELNDQVRAIYRNYRDNVGEAVDIHISDLVKTSGLTVAKDSDGNLISTQTAFYESLFTPNENGTYDLNEVEVDRVVEKYANQGNIIQTEKEAFKEQLIEKAKIVQQQKLVRDKEASDALNARTSRLKADTEATENMANSIEEQRSKIVDMANIIAKGNGESQLKMLINTPEIRDARYINNATEFIKHMMFRDRENAPLNSKGVKFWNDQKVTSGGFKDEPPTYEEVVKEKGDIYQYYLKIWNDAGNKPVVLFDYKDKARGYNLVDSKDPEQIQSVIMTLPSTQQKGIENNPNSGTGIGVLKEDNPLGDVNKDLTLDFSTYEN